MLPGFAMSPGVGGRPVRPSVGIPCLRCRSVNCRGFGPIHAGRPLANVGPLRPDETPRRPRDRRPACIQSSIPVPFGEFLSIIVDLARLDTDLTDPRRTGQWPVLGSSIAVALLR